MNLLNLILVFTVSLALGGCAVDYETKAGSKVRFSLTGTPADYLEAGRSFRK